jgi:hypothetical protein
LYATMADVTGSLPPSEQSSTSGDVGIAGSVSAQWVEVYPPDATEPDVEPVPPRRSGATANVAATSMFALTLVLVVVGSITPLFRASVALGPSFTNINDVLSMDAWQLHTVEQVPDAQLPSQAEPAPVPVGYPLLLVALLLAVVIVLRFMANRERGARVLGIATATFLAGLVVALGMFEVGWRAFGDSGAIGPLSADAGVGFWVLVIAALMGVAAAVVAFRSVPVAATPVVVPVADPPLVPPGQPAEWPVVAVIPNDERTNW